MEASEKLERLSNALADDLDDMSDEELLAELNETGEDGDAIADQTRTLIADAIRQTQRNKPSRKEIL